MGTAGDLAFVVESVTTKRFLREQGCTPLMAVVLKWFNNADHMTIRKNEAAKAWENAHESAKLEEANKKSLERLGTFLSDAPAGPRSVVAVSFVNLMGYFPETDAFFMHDLLLIKDEEKKIHQLDSFRMEKPLQLSKDFACKQINADSFTADSKEFCDMSSSVTITITNDGVQAKFLDEKLLRVHKGITGVGTNATPENVPLIPLLIVSEVFTMPSSDEIRSNIEQELDIDFLRELGIVQIGL
eukprot:TRINITY_DN29280_c0_g1_i1.p1 TRINITY_DN29280_c0_g1~~TRINITY_DN29280_c0_g1_i1.p1  ORF type:complete len:258 (+),score=15.23 TRINITY_DN29280_c0_g1_i1:46-774(+)